MSTTSETFYSEKNKLVSALWWGNYLMLILFLNYLKHIFGISALPFVVSYANMDISVVS